MRSELTRFVATHIAGSTFDGLCFGDPVRQVIRKRRTVYYFSPRPDLCRAVVAPICPRSPEPNIGGGRSVAR